MASSQEAQSALYAYWRNRISSKYEHILLNLDLHAMLDKLLSKEVISRMHYKQIKEKSYDREQIHYFLEIMKERPDAALEKFRHVLEETQQRHVAELLTGEGECMSSLHSEILTKQRSNLVEKMDLETILDILQGKEAITSIDAQCIKDTQVTHQKHQKLLDIISKKGDHVYYRFIDALRESNQGHLAASLQETYNSGQHEPSSMQLQQDLLKQMKEHKECLSSIEKNVSNKFATLENKIDQMSQKINEISQQNGDLKLELNIVKLTSQSMIRENKELKESIIKLPSQIGQQAPRSEPAVKQKVKPDRVDSTVKTKETAQKATVPQAHSYGTESGSCNQNQTLPRSSTPEKKVTSRHRTKSFTTVAGPGQEFDNWKHDAPKRQSGLTTHDYGGGIDYTGMSQNRPNLVSQRSMQDLPPYSSLPPQPSREVENFRNVSDLKKLVKASMDKLKELKSYITKEDEEPVTVVETTFNELTKELKGHVGKDKKWCDAKKDEILKGLKTCAVYGGKRLLINFMESDTDIQNVMTQMLQLCNIWSDHNVDISAGSDTERLNEIQIARDWKDFLQNIYERTMQYYEQMFPASTVIASMRSEWEKWFKSKDINFGALKRMTLKLKEQLRQRVT